MESEFDTSNKSLLVDTKPVESVTSGLDEVSDFQLQQCTRPPFARVLCQRLLLFSLGLLLLIGAGIGSIYRPSNMVSVCSVTGNGSMSTCSDKGNISVTIVMPTVVLQPSQSPSISSASFSQVICLPQCLSVCLSVCPSSFCPSSLAILLEGLVFILII